MGNGWKGAPDWVIDLLELQYYLMIQNEEILAKLHARGTRLSDKDQKALNDLTSILKGTNTKIDAAKQDK
jgi:hypothetical protein